MLASTTTIDRFGLVMTEGERVRLAELQQRRAELAVERTEAEVDQEQWRADPVGWMSETLGVRLWSGQARIAESVRANRSTAVHACHGVGKSHFAARLAAWWIGSHPVGEATVITTAPSGDQVRGILWQEIATAHDEADGALPGHVNQVEWWADGKQLAIGRKPPDQKARVSFQGFHNRYVLAILDEASGIPDQMWEAINKVVTGPDDRILAIGNPDYVRSRWWQVCQGGRWNVIHIGVDDTPLRTGEPAPDGATLISQQFIDDVISDYGVDSPQYQAQVSGEFPDDRTDGVVPWSAAAKCRADGLEFPDADDETVLGCDVGGGGDMTVIWSRTGPIVGKVWREKTDSTEAVAALCRQAIDETGATHINVDVTGLGWGVPDLLLRDRDVTVGRFNFGAGARESTRFANARAELWWHGRELAQAQGWGLAAIDEGTVAQLCEPRWFENARGRIQIEEKADVRRRIGRSPDDADALLLAFWEAPVAVGHAGPPGLRANAGHTGGALDRTASETDDQGHGQPAPRTGVGRLLGAHRTNPRGL